MNSAFRACVAVVLAIFAFSSCAFAIGIGPPRVSLTFSPNLQTDLNYVVVNTGTEPLDALLYVKGDLSQYITLDKTAVTLGPKSQVAFTAHIALPSSISPGSHDIRIGAVEAEAGQGGTVGARAGVESVLTIAAPLSGKVIQVTASAEDVAIGNPATLHYEITSIGNETINELQVLVAVLDSEGSTVGGLSSLKQSLQPGETASIDLQWTPQSVGSYTARSRILYDSNETDVNTTFSAGQPSVKIVNVTASPFTPGQIVKASIDIENEWSQSMNVYARAIILDGQTEVASIRSANMTLEPFATDTIDVFVETTGLEYKTYTLRAMVYFDGRSVKKDITLNPVQRQSVQFELQYVLFALVIAVAVIEVFIWSKRKTKKIRRR